MESTAGKFWRDTITISGRQVGANIIGFATVVLIARTFGPEISGEYGLVVFFFTALVTFFSCGFSTSIVYFISTGRVRTSVVVRAMLVIGVGLGLGACAVGSLTIFTAGEFLFPGSASFPFFISFAALPAALLAAFLLAVYQARHNFPMVNAVSIAQPGSTLAVGLCLWGVDQFDLFSAVSAFVFGHIVALGVAVIGMQPFMAPWRLCRLFRRSGRNETAFFRQAVGYGLIAHAANIVTFLVYRFDLVIVNALLNSAAVGLYLVAVQVGERLSMLSQAMSFVLFPKICKLERDNQGRLELVMSLVRISLVIGVGGAVGLWFVADWAFTVIFGSDWAAATPVFVSLLPGIVALTITRLLATDIAARGRPGINLTASLVGLAVNIVANFLLIPSIGVIGAGVATSLSYCVVTVVLMVAWCQIAGVKAISLFQLSPGEIGGIKRVSRAIARTFH